MKICPNGPSLLTKIAMIPIRGKNVSKRFLHQNQANRKHETWIKCQGLRTYQIYSDDYPRLTCDLIFGKVLVHPYIYMGKTYICMGKMFQSLIGEKYYSMTEETNTFY